VIPWVFTERDISIKELKNTPTFCVSTIHMLKGFECDNTAVQSATMDIIQTAQKDHRAIKGACYENVVLSEPVNSFS